MTDEQYPPFPDSSESLRARLTNDDHEHVVLTLEIARHLFAIERQRTRDIEGKAGLVMGALGVVAAILAGIATLLGSVRTTLETLPFVVMGCLFIGMAISFCLSIVWALQVLRVGVVHYPGPGVILDEQETSSTVYARTHAADLLIAFWRDLVKNNRRASSLRRAQTAFVVFVGILFTTIVFTTLLSMFS